MAYASLIGAEVKRKEDPRLITGTGNYVGDLKLPGMQHVALVRSPYPHARIRGIDAAAALAMPGVTAVVTGQDLANKLQPLASSGGEGGTEGGTEGEPAARIRHALAVDKVRHTGEAVAAVVAASPEIAEDAAQAVVVDYEPLPSVADMEKALAPDAPRLFDGMADNVDHVLNIKRGDPDAAFSGAHRVVKQRMINQRLSGVPMEGRAVAAAPDHWSGGVTLWTSTQAPHLMRGDVARVLGLPENQVRVIAPDVGGGFGVKIGLYPEDALLAYLARELGVPVHWEERRTEHMLATTHGRAQINDIEAAVAEDGTVTGIRMRVLADLGAYPVAAVIPNLTAMMGVGVYKVPSVDLEVKAVYTNTTPVAAYRGAGRPEAAYYLERLMDLVAAELGKDPVEIRRKNFIPPDAFPYKTPTGLVYDSGEYDKALSRALEVSNYAALREEQRRRRASGDGPLLGIGLACFVEMCGFGPYESAQIKVEPTGTVTVTTGISPHGQGGGTTFAQIVADRLGVDFDKVQVLYGDTATTPMGQGTMGSRSIAVGGSALYRAADKIIDKAKRIAAHMLEAAVEDIEVVDGRYQVRGVPARALTLADIAQKAYTDKLPPDIETGLEAIDYFRPPSLIYPFGAHVAVVEVEPDTGVVRVREYYSVDDCGPRISPKLVAGQVHGGLAQGIAQALIEEVVYDESGQLLSGSLMDYAIPKADLFPSFRLDQTVTPTPHNPLGAKGIGELATIGSTPAIANAVMDALSPLGIRHLDIPLRPERIWRAINSQSNGRRGG